MRSHTRRPRSPIEQDPHRPAIERELALGRSLTSIARKYGRTIAALHRFRDRMPLQVRAAIAASVLKPGTEDYERLKVDEAEGILTTLANQRARLLVMQDAAMERDEISVANGLARTIHQSVELTGRYLGEFAQYTVTSNISILASEDYLRVRQALTVALRPFPEARRAVAAALQQAENQTAQRLLEDAGKAPQSAVIDQPPSGKTVSALLRASNGAAEAPA
jgi:hypothetical protein